MNRMVRVSVFCALMVAFAASTNAATLTGDTFSYTGALTDNGWAAHSGAGNKVIMADGAVATLEQSGGSGEDVNLAFAAQGAADTTYASMLVTVLSGGGDPVDGLDANGLYFTHFKDEGTFGFRARTFVATPVDEGDFTFGLSADDSSYDVTFDTDFDYDTQYKLTLSYDAATGSATLWVDAADESGPSITDAIGTVGTLIEAIALRQSNDYTGFIEIDNVGAGTTFMDSMIPEPAALTLLGILLLGVIGMRKRLG